MKKELIQYLFEASSGDKSFQERFQSFLDQIPKPSGASAAPGKEGFFINFFAGMFASLRSTELAEKLKIKDLHFRLLEKKLHIIAEIGEEKKKRLFIFSESGNKKSNDDLEAEMKNIGKGLSATKVLIGREVLEGEEKKKEEDQKWKFKVLVEHKTGSREPETKGLKTIDCKVGKNLGDNIVELGRGKLKDSTDAVEKVIQEAEKLYSDLKGKFLIQNSDKEAAQHGFINGMLMNFRYRYNLRLYSELLTGRGYSDIVLLVRGGGRSWKAVPVIMELKPKGSVENALSEASSYARGLLRNKMRLLTNSEHVICMGVNLNDRKDSYIISDQPSKIKRNEKPVMQSLLDIVYSDEECKDKESQVKNLLGQLYYTFPSEQYTRDYLSRFLLGQLSLLKKPKKAESMNVYLFNHSGKDIEERDIEEHLTTYIVVVKEQGDRNRVLIFHVQEAGTCRFQYNEYSFCKGVLSDIGLTEVNYQDLIEVYIDGYKEVGSVQSAPSPGSFFKDQGLVNIRKGYIQQFKGHYGKTRRTRSDSTEEKKFKGSVESIDLNAGLAGKFQKVINYQQEELRKKIEEKRKSRELGRGINKLELGAYKDFFDMIKGLMCNEYGKSKQGFVSMISNESRFKAFLDGLLTGLSDLDKDRIIAVLTEFQVGEGKRIDIMIQVVDNNNPNDEDKIKELKESVSMGFELKFSNTTKNEASKKLRAADSQIEGYARCKNIKSITEGDNVAFIGVSFNQGAGSKDELILLSENLIVAGVPHSSTDVSIGSQLSGLSLQNPQLSIFTEQLRNVLP